MKKLIGPGCVAVVLCLVGGCGAKSADALVKEQTTLMNDYADAVDKKDDAKAKDIDAKLAESKKQLEGLKLSDEEKKNVMEKNPDHFKAAVRYSTAKLGGAFKGIRIPNLPGDKKDK